MKTGILIRNDLQYIRRMDSLTSRSDICVSKVSLRYKRAFKSDLGFLLQSLMFRLPQKQASQHDSGVPSKLPSVYLGSNLWGFSFSEAKIFLRTLKKNPDGWSRLAAELVPKESGEHTCSECLERKGWRCNISRNALSWVFQLLQILIFTLPAMSWIPFLQTVGFFWKQ